MKAVFDTNILIDYLNGIKDAADELGLYSERLISIVTWMEVLAGAKDSKTEMIIRRFLNSFQVIQLNQAISETAVDLRKQYQVKLPDAIIYATARENGCLLVTRNVKDFDVSLPDIRLPYKV